MFLNYVIATLSICLYLHGFFPIPARPIEKSPPSNRTQSPNSRKLVFVVIDALRVDFISDTKTPFLSKSFKNNGCFIHLKVETPTVTLPRIKALTTGNVPQFVDIILNLANPTKVEDSFIHRAHAAGKKIVFYGDDIWVKLFPDEFVRSEGTSSFFVNDFTEVDDNVTRNIRWEVERNDWDIMILHYLGLDHIGHVYGPKSPLILTKLKEMDSILREIYRTNAILMVTGDHGMRDSGGHGGSTHPETNVPLIVLGLPCNNDSFAQIDIPANLAILQNFDVPTTSIGQLHQSLLSHLPQSEFLQALRYNTFLLTNKLDLCGETIHTADHFFDLFLLNHNKELAENAAQLYKNCAQKISESLQKTSVRQNITSLIIATVTIIVILLKIFQKLVGVSPKTDRFQQMVMLAVLFLQFAQFHVTMDIVLTLTVLFLLVKNLVCFETKHLKHVDRSFLTLMSTVHPLSFLSSSFLEEEHQFWYFFTNTFFLFNIMTDLKKIKYWILLFVAIRFIRTINQVGDKWAALPDLADWLLQNENYLFLQVIFIAGLISSYFCNSIFAKSKFSKFIDALVLILIYIFRSVFENIILGQVLWFLLFIKFILCVSTKESFASVWLLLINLLLKPYNVILIPVCVLASRLFHKALKTENVIMAHRWLGNLLFYAQGHDNSLASVDISSGYIGLREYNPLLVFPQVLCHTYAFPVLSDLLLFTNRKVNIFKGLPIFVLFRLYIIVLVFIITFIHRHHLFIWSVFAPKLFVEASHFGFLFIEVCCYYFIDLIKRLCY
ncbi:GPI ethanolamine phosphate transferase 2 [Tribolium madens]|uniref:GPI ethanolamine phosphate transferase 2 n=1 Tax=Tribolium madens TaxID=41895 RepID=UPI001CF735DB|nr:GPI ethanolamine phosphate transferase 2 [Tribolium madens]XP_044263600.1 GPI ethanolamine phosphate transferase 2 [Tribolium madens]